MLKNLKYLLSAQLVLSTLAYGDLNDTNEDYAQESDEESLVGFNDEEYSLENDPSDIQIRDLLSAGDEITSVPTIKPRKKMCHYSFFGEMLYLKPYFQGAPSIAISNQANSPPLSAGTSSLITNNKYATFNLDFDFGLRVGFGFKAHWMGIENELIWMRYHTATHHKFPHAVRPERTLGPYWNRSASEPCGSGFKMDYHTSIDWDVIDATSKVPLTPLSRVTLSPKIGVRGLISEIKFRVHDIKDEYGCFLPSRFSPPLNTQTNKVSQRYNAVGLLGGFDSDINIGKGFHFDTIFDAALLFGELHAKNIGSKTSPISPPDSIPTSWTAKDSFYTVRPVIDLQLLLAWKKECFRSKVGFDISIGYEVHYLPNFLHFMRLSDSGDEIERFDFSMQGLSAGLGISF